MNFNGIVSAIICFVCIGAFHPIVIKAEYYLSAKCWPLFLTAGAIALAISLAVTNTYLSLFFGILGCSCFWSIKELFERHGFHIVYDKDQDEHVSDGFFFTVGYGSMPSSDLVAALLRYGICAISLTSTGSLQNGVRVCVSQMNREEQYDLLDRRLRDFAQDYARK